MMLNEQKIGRTFNAIVDRKEGDLWVMRSQYDSPEVDTEIYVNHKSLVTGQFYKVKITAAEVYDLYGEIVEEL
jgi:ribosomal protein S12 methylthiotransferase